jgi:TolB-like protein
MSEDIDRENPKPASVDRLSLLWRRINDHKMVQWGVGYVALAYGIQHAVILTSESFEWPHAVSRISMLLLALGLPVVMTLAWYHGERASRRITGPELTIISILLVIGSLLFYVFVQPAAEVATQAVPSEKAQSASVGARPASTAPAGISVAVLPFVNLSDDRQQEFFSDGMTEEITSALAKVPGLRVLGRTSAFEFKGQNKDLRTIGQALGATHLIEGSVRKDGNEVRITTQLIRADDGTHQWTESYDRELKGVFAVQEDIAQAIAKSLRVPLGLKEGQNLVSNRTSNTDSYQDYLRARAFNRAREAGPGGPLIEAAKLLEQVVARDPNYAPAWGLLGQVYAASLGVNLSVNDPAGDIRRFKAESLQKTEAAAQRATRLDPNNADGYTALATARMYRSGFVQAEDLYKQALSLDPGNPEALGAYSIMLAGVGRLKDSLAMRLRLQAQEPFVPVFNRVTARILWENGRNDEAIAILKASPLRTAPVFLAEVYASMGRYSEAADALRGIPSGIFLPGAVEEAIRLLRTAPAQDTSPQTILRGEYLGFVYLYVGAPDRVLDFYERLAEFGYAAPGNDSRLWGPSYAPVRKTERLKTHVRKAGMVDYWRARGWPDLCRPVGADDFVCD